MDIRSYRASRQGQEYEPFLSGDTEYRPGEKGYVWVKAIKPNSG